ALGAVLHDQGKVDEALDSLRQALRLRPSDRLRIAAATCLPLIYQSVAELESWRNRLTEELRKLHEQQVTLDVTAEPARPVFFLAYQGGNDRDLQRAVARLYRAPGAADRLPVPAPAPPGRKLRVGFLSSYFTTHTVGYWMRGLVARLARDAFEVT